MTTRWLGLGLAFAAGLLAIGWADPAHAQLREIGAYLPGVAVPSYDAETVVFREHVEVVLPPAYLLVPRPKPPVRGYYGWKFTFNGAPTITLVFRPDSAVSARGDVEIVRASSLYVCTDATQNILTCTARVAANAKVAGGKLIVDITDPGLVGRIRESRPTVLQLFEPGGRDGGPEPARARLPGSAAIDPIEEVRAADRRRTRHPVRRTRPTVQAR